jgi:hypothetical protein
MPNDGLGTTMFSGHKHTNRALPINNKLCNQRWVDRCQQLHRMRLNSIKPAIGEARQTQSTGPAPCLTDDVWTLASDNIPPKRYKHLFQNLKKAQLEDGAHLVCLAPRPLLNRVRVSQNATWRSSGKTGCY